MDRSDFGGWGLGLSPQDFACALAGLGALPVAPQGDLTADLTRALEGNPVLWRAPPLDSTRRDWRSAAPAERVANAWREALESRRATHDSPLRLELEMGRWAPDWPIRRLVDSATGVQGVYVKRLALPDRIRWSWPLEVGLLDDPDSEQLARELRAHSTTIGGSVDLLQLDVDPPACDVLLLPLDLTEAITQILSRQISASCVVLLGGAAMPWRRAAPLIDGLAAYARAGGVAICRIDEGDRATWLDTVIGSLHEDLTFDVALHRGAREAPPLLLAATELVEETRPSRIAASLADEIRSRILYTTHSIPDLQMSDAQAEGVAEILMADGHDQLAAASDEAEQAIAERPPARFLQAQVFETSETDRIRREGALRAHATHLITVRIGPPDEEWHAGALVFPDYELPRGRTNRLTVVFAELVEGGDPQVQTIDLPPAGPSTACNFFVRTGAPGDQHAARIVVLHENRVLQTAILRFDVAATPDDPSAGPVSLDTESVLRLETDDLDTRSRFGASLLLNHTRDGTPGLLVVSDTDVTFRASQGFERAVADIRDVLEQATMEPRGYDKLRDPQTIEFLIQLANHGAMLNEFLKEQPGIAKIARRKRIQVIALDPDAYFPIEFVYSGLAPERDAELCPNAERALEHGQCADCRSRTERVVVCPLNFWGLAKVIERHPYQAPGRDVGNWDYLLRTEPGKRKDPLATKGAAVFAGSAKVDEEVRGGRAAVFEALQQLTENRATRATRWKAWKSSVEDDAPTLLVALPHTVTDQLGPGLEIEDGASGQVLTVGHIDADYVHGENAHSPIVILLGCSTASPDLPLASFPGQFRRAGAAIVVATLTKVLGRQAAPVAGRLAELLVERSAERGAFFGEVLTEIRRELMRAGRPLAMTLIAYGDADWPLAREPVPARRATRTRAEAPA